MSDPEWYEDIIEQETIEKRVWELSPPKIEYIIAEVLSEKTGLDKDGFSFSWQKGGFVTITHERDVLE